MCLKDVFCGARLGEDWVSQFSACTRSFGRSRRSTATLSSWKTESVIRQKKDENGELFVKGGICRSQMGESCHRDV